MREALEALERYFELTLEPSEDRFLVQNPEWDRGYQAAMAIIRNQIREGKE